MMKVWNALCILGKIFLVFILLSIISVILLINLIFVSLIGGIKILRAKIFSIHRRLNPKLENPEKNTLVLGITIISQILIGILQLLHWPFNKLRKAIRNWEKLQNYLSYII